MALFRNRHGASAEKRSRNVYNCMRMRAALGKKRRKNTTKWKKVQLLYSALDCESIVGGRQVVIRNRCGSIAYAIDYLACLSSSDATEAIEEQELADQ